jgi:hypothetical protein
MGTIVFLNNNMYSHSLLMREQSYFPYFEMCQARAWGMLTMNSTPNVKLVLNVEGVDETSKWFLTNDIVGSKWRGILKGKTIEFVNSEKPTTTWHFRFFTSTPAISMFISLYGNNGVQFAPLCLAIWNRMYPMVANNCSSEGRCPARLS